MFARTEILHRQNVKSGRAADHSISALYIYTQTIVLAYNHLPERIATRRQAATQLNAIAISRNTQQ